MEEATDKNTAPETTEDSLYQEKEEEEDETSDLKDERGTPLEDEDASNASESNKFEKDENKEEEDAEDEEEELLEDDNEEGGDELSNTGDNDDVTETKNDKIDDVEESKDEHKEELEDTTEHSNQDEEERETSENIENDPNDDKGENDDKEEIDDKEENDKEEIDDKEENDKEDQLSPASENFQEESESKSSPNNDKDRAVENEEREVDAENDNENEESISKDDGKESSCPDIEEVDANVSINKHNQQDEEEDVLSDDRTQTAEKQKSPAQSQMEIDTEESQNKISTNDDTLDDTSKTSDVQDVEMKSVESNADASEKDKSTETSENEKQSKQSDDKFDQLFDNVRKSTDAEPMETDDADQDPDPFEKDNEESQDGDKDELGGDNLLESRDEPDNSNQVDNASQSELPDTENDNEIVESQSENVQEEAQGESADVCLIPDNDEELTGAEKEQAILARQNAEKEDAEKEAENEATENTEIDVDKETNEQEVEAQETAEDVIIEPEVIIEVGKIIEDDRKVPIISIIHVNEKCIECSEEKSCEFRFKNDGNNDTAYSYLCNQECCDTLINKEKKIKFFMRKRKYIVEDLSEPTTESCVFCKEKKECKYSFKQDKDLIYICTDDCFNNLSRDEPEKLRLKRNLIRVKNLSSTASTTDGSITKSVSSEPKVVARSAREAELAKLNREASFERRCANCCLLVHMTAENLVWETLDFCNQLCLSKYQHTVGEKCRTCKRFVSQTSLGKYCVRFGFEICQFCCAACLDKYKKSLKNCSYCQLDISKTNDGFLAPVGDNEQFKDFCSQLCMKKYDSCLNPKKKTKTEQCSVCNNKKNVQVELVLDERGINFCSNPCFSAFKFVNNIVPDKCNLCSKYFERKSTEHYTIYQDNVAQIFCGKICMNMFITQKRKIVFCQWCKVKKYNFDMIEKQQLNSNEKVTMCSLNCLVLYEVSLNRITKQKVKCDHCVSEKTPQYHLTMSDSSMRNFCTYQCVMQFQSRFSSTPLTLDNDNVRQNELLEGNKSNLPFPTGLPKRIKSNISSVQSLHVPVQSTQPTMPIIANITSLATESPAARNRNRNRARSKNNIETYPPQNIKQNRMYSTAILQSKSSIYAPPKVKVPKKTVGTTTKEPANKTFVVELPLKLKEKSNMNTQCMPQTETVGVTCKPQSCDSQIQTDNDLRSKKLIPVPIPIYIPHPMQGFPIPRPIPIPFAFPIPVPIFIPTTKNSAQGIMKEIKKLQDKMPADPYEAELLMMAELVASDKKKEEESEEENNEVGYNNDNSYGEDVLQMALKMATEYDEPPSVDLTSTISNESSNLLYPQMQINQRSGRGKKRISPANNIPRENNIQPIIKKRRISENEVDPSQTIPVEKPDANMCLKYTFGVNAWKQWVMTKNAELEKSSIRRKPFKSELLQMTADELSFSLCLFVKEVRKPNGTEYAPDTIYYLVLGIQQYLYENGRIDNIFTDPYYERFTDCLDDVARKFSVLYNDSQYIVTRVEEEHLWECKQLGAHSPHVLLSTLMFFNTKHFNLTTVEEHMQLSFSHIMKHWKRNAQGTKQPGSRNVLLRFYPPNTGQADNKKKKVYEQQENEANPLRCPVRLYEFYLSKCPESVKTRNDVFYLQPERSCVPDSPVWYSTQPLSQESLQKMLHRVKMVKEINVALLTI